MAIIDPKRGFEYEGLKEYDDPKRIIRDNPARFIYRPKPVLLSDLDAYNEVYKHLYMRGDILVYTDDVVGVIPRLTPPHYLKVCYQMGRQKRVACLSSFQRPFSIPMVLKSECQKFYIFKLMTVNDIRDVKQYCPGYDPYAFPDRHTFSFYDTNTMDTSELQRIGEK